MPAQTNNILRGQIFRLSQYTLNSQNSEDFEPPFGGGTAQSTVSSVCRNAINMPDTASLLLLQVRVNLVSPSSINNFQLSVDMVAVDVNVDFQDSSLINPETGSLLYQRLIMIPSKTLSVSSPELPISLFGVDATQERADGFDGLGFQTGANKNLAPITRRFVNTPTYLNVPLAKNVGFRFVTTPDITAFQDVNFTVTSYAVIL